MRYLVANRGFVYHSDTTADTGDHCHANCGCRIVPGFEVMEVEGYDPNGLYARYKDCADALDDDWLYRRYQALSEANRTEKTFDEYKTDQVLAEMRTRNPSWLNKNIPGKIVQEAGARPLPKEAQVGNWLSQHGFDIEFRATRSSESKKTSDIYIGSQIWEIKQPTGNGKQTIYHQFEEAALQSNRLVIDVSEVVKSEPGERWNVESVEKEVQRLINWHYKGGNGKSIQFVEVLLVNGVYLKRYKKGS